MTKYKVDFYQVNVVPTARIQSVSSGLDLMLQGNIANTHTLDGMTREVWGLNRRNVHESLGGQLRKFRVSDLPEIGAVGAESEMLELDTGQGLIEQNFFVYYRHHNLLGWHSNVHASHPNQFAKLLTELWGTRVSIDPVIQRDAVERLMRGGTTIKKLIISLPRPTNPELFDNDDYGRSLLHIMDQSGSSSIHVELGVDLRRDRLGTLSEDIKRTLYNAFRSGATVARAYVNEDGLAHPIDLVADRVSSTQHAETNGRFLPSASMYALIDAARAECQEAINGYFTEN